MALPAPSSAPHAQAPRRLFSASRVLGSRPGSVGVGVAGCPGTAWVWSQRCRTAPVSLALAVPAGLCARSAAASVLAAWPARGLSVSVRVHRGRSFLRVRGQALVLRALARWWGAPPRTPAAGGWLPPGVALAYPVSPAYGVA
jgi:hypothetical protein